MVDPLAVLRPRLESALSVAFPEARDTDPALHRSVHADYQADLALGLARRLKRNPREVAAEVAAQLVRDDVLEAAEVSGPGFINLRLRTEYLTAEIGRMLGDERLGVDRPQSPGTVVIDYSAPNLAKDMHVGHLRSTIIGDALARSLEFLGDRVIRQNHIGDWGTPFGMLIEQMIDEQAATGDAGMRELSTFYRAARVKFDSEPGFADRARRRVVLLQSGDAETLALWRKLIALTMAFLERLYAKLNVTLKPEDVVGESAYNPDLAPLVEDLERRGVAQISQGALCVFPPGFVGRNGEPLPLIVRKQDGGFGYGATDLAAIRHRLGKLGATRVLYVVGAPQQQHLAMVFAAARMAGWATDETRLEHVAFGSVLGQDKKMLKSRSGESVSLDELLDGAVERARQLVDLKSPELGDDERGRIAQAVGIGAVKYADLVNDRIKDYVFDWNRMLAFDGNTAPYLMYAHARICSILRKAGGETGAAEVRLDSDAERVLALELLQFPGAVARVGESLQPHRLCQHLFDLAAAFTTFYEKCPVLKAEEPARASRLTLCRLTARVLAKGLDLLGIAAPEQM
jgi:arginyl-tRNA synthetase